MYQCDIIIVGAGITGTSLARALSRFNVSVLVLEKGSDIAEGATKANSGIVHAGYDAVPGSRKAFYNVRGSMMYEALCNSLCVPYKKCGSLVIGFDDADLATLEKLLKQGTENGVPGIRLLTGEQALQLEPSLNHRVKYALDIPTGAIVSPYELAFALADDAALNGVQFVFGKTVCDAAFQSDGWKIHTESGEKYSCKVFVNCAGAFGANLHNIVSDIPLQMTHRRGQYYLLDRTPTPPFSRTVFQCPSHMGKGVLVSPTVHGNILIGPNAEDIQDPLDTSTTAEGLSSVLRTAAKTWPDITVRTNITNFSGIRAHLNVDDFVIGPVSGTEAAFEAIGIESPGLSSAPAIAEDLAGQISSYLNLQKKATVVSLPRREKPFHEMNDEERDAAIRANPEYGNIICRCETVTEAEIRASVRRPVGARTIDGVKRRTRAGMGRCQGGFCCPRVAQILCEETGVPLDHITKCGGDSFLLKGTIASFMKGDVRID